MSLKVLLFWLRCGCVLPDTVSNRSYDVEAGDLQVYNCFFIRFDVFNGNGGVFYAEFNCKMAVVSCSFVHCRARIGGAIYCGIYNASLFRICANNCDAVESKCFGYIASTYVSLSGYWSLCYCNNNNNGRDLVGWVGGGFKNDYYNASFNCIPSNSVGYLDVTATTSQFNYWNVINNTSNSNGIMLLNGQMKYLNYFNVICNSCSSSRGVIYGEQSYNVMEIKYCCFFYNKYVLFYSIQYASFRVRMSYIIHDGQYFYCEKPTIIVTQSLSFTISSTHNIVHFKTNQCENEYDFSKTFEQSLEYNCVTSIGSKDTNYLVIASIYCFALQ